MGVIIPNKLARFFMAYGVCCFSCYSAVCCVQMANKTEPRLHILDDVCTESWHILCSGNVTLWYPGMP